VAAAGIVVIPGLPLVFVVLVVNVVAVLAMPPALVFLYLLVNDKEIMEGVPSPRWMNALAAAVVVVLTAAGILYGVSVVAPKALEWIGRL
jgi:Mn2+/Fe2+ NRAMP family transporter